MKKILIAVTSIAMLSLSACSQPQQGFVLKGKVGGLSTNQLYLMDQNSDAFPKMITAEADGSFIVRDTIKGDNPQLYALIDQTQKTLIKNGLMVGVQYYFFAQNGDKLLIEGSSDNFRWMKTTGSPLNDQLAELRAQLNPLQQQEKKIWDEVDKVLMERNPQKNAAKIDSLQNLTDPYVAQMNEIRLKYIQGHPNSIISAVALNEIARSMKVDDLKSTYASLGKNIQELPMLGVVRELIGLKESEANTQYGMPAPDFVKVDKNGKKIKLSDYRGKYVLLDFWGSWCGPCRASHPHLKETAEKYKADGLVVIGIAEERSSDKSEWLKAIKDDGLTWTQIMNDEGKEKADVVKLFGVKAFPTKILIDKDGKIINRYEGTTMGARTLIESPDAADSGTDASAASSSAASTATAPASKNAGNAAAAATAMPGSSSKSMTKSDMPSASVKQSPKEPDTPIDMKLKEIFKK